MNYRIVFLLSLGLTACSTASHQPSHEIPRAWTQIDAEEGKLPVGRVIAVQERIWKGRSPPSDSPYQWGTAFGVVGVLVSNVVDDLSNGDLYYRYAIRLEGSSEIAVREEYAAYKVGDCVALRTTPLLLVPALADACAKETVQHIAQPGHRVAEPPYAAAQPVDQLPMYGAPGRTVSPAVKAIDDKLISDTTKYYGSLEKASQAFVGNGFAYYKRNDLVAAMRRFNQAWLLDPNNPEAYWGFAAVLHNKGKNCEAMVQFQKALSFGRYVEGMIPDAARITTLCAVDDKSLSEEDRDKLFANADALYAEALAKDPNKGYVYGSIATARYWRGQYAEAWQAVKLARTNGDKLPEQFLNLLRAKLAEPS